MRKIIAALTLCLFSLPVACQAQQPVATAAPVYVRHAHAMHHTGGKCACGHVYQPVAPAVPVASACGGCDVGCGGVAVSGCGGVAVSGCGGVVGGCGGVGVGGCGGCGGGLCSNWPEFYNRLYAEFYANNQWYVVAKQKENAARLARLRGLPEPEEVKTAK